MTPGKELVHSRVMSARTRRYSLRGRHTVFGDDEIFIRHHRDRLIVKLNGREVFPDDLAEPVRMLIDDPFVNSVAWLLIRNDIVEVHAREAKAWEGGHLNDTVRARLEEIALTPLPRAA